MWIISSFGIFWINRITNKAQTIKGNWQRQAGSLAIYPHGEGVVSRMPTIHLKMVKKWDTYWRAC